MKKSTLLSLFIVMSSGCDENTPVAYDTPSAPSGVDLADLARIAIDVPSAALYDASSESPLILDLRKVAAFRISLSASVPLPEEDAVQVVDSSGEHHSLQDWGGSAGATLYLSSDIGLLLERNDVVAFRVGSKKVAYYYVDCETGCVWFTYEDGSVEGLQP